MNLSVFSITGRVVAAVLAASAPPALAGGELAAFILQPYADEVAACEAGKTALQVLADREDMELREDLALLQRQYEVINLKVSMLEKNWAHRLEIAKQTYATAVGMDTYDNGRVPHFTAKPEDLKAAYNRLKEEYDKVQQEISEGSYSFQSQAVGKITRMQLDDRIADVTQNLADHRERVSKGEFGIHSEALGGYDRNEMDACIDRATARANEISEAIARGDYEVDIPGYGTTSRNQLNARIADMEQEISDLADRYARGKARIHRGRFGHREWWDANRLDGVIERKRKEVAEQAAYLETPAYRYHLPDKGMVSAESLEEAGKRLSDKYDEMVDVAAKGLQRVSLPDNRRWNMQGINDYIANAGKEGAGEDVRKKAEELKGWIGDHVKASQHDINIQALEKAMITVWLAELAKLKVHELDGARLDLTQWERYPGDYNDELQAQITRMKAELAHMQAALAFLP